MLVFNPYFLFVLYNFESSEFRVKTKIYGSRGEKFFAPTILYPMQQITPYILKTHNFLIPFNCFYYYLSAVNLV